MKQAANRRRKTFRWDAFISHSWADKGAATSMVEYLRKLHDCKVWVDYENLSRGVNLNDRITADLARSRLVLVLWSRSARRSRWVSKELQAAAGYGCDILPCVLDRTPLEGNSLLAGRLYCDFSSSFMQGMSQLVAKLYQHEDVELRSRVALMQHRAKWPTGYPDVLHGIAAGQRQVLEALDQGKQRKAAQVLAKLDPIVEKTLKAFPHDPDVVGLAAYQRKDAYQVKVWRHWNDRKVRQRHRSLLDRAEELFYRALALQPHDTGALNGLGSVAILRGHKAMAEHFALRAAEAAKRQGVDYEAAWHDVELIRQRQRSRDDAGLFGTEFAVSTGTKHGALVLGFVGMAQALPVGAQHGLLGALLGFVAYLRQFGVDASGSAELRVVVDPDSGIQAGYDAETRTISVRPVWVRDTDVFARLVGLHAFGRMLGGRGKGVAAGELIPLISGLADYFACSYHDDACLGRMAAPIVFGRRTPCLRDLRTDLRRCDVPDGALPHEAGLVWAAALWEVRDRLGPSAADRLILGAWQAASTVVTGRALERRFAKQLLALAERSTSGDPVAGVRAILHRRGLARQGRGPHRRAG